MAMLSFSKNNRYRIAVEKWTIDIASLWKLTIAEVYATVCTHTIMNRKWHEDLARILAYANSVYALFVFAFFFTYFYICFCHHRYEDLTRILTTQLCCFFAFLFLYLPFKCFCISFCHHLYEDLARILAYATCLQPANFDCALLFLYLSLKCFCICFCHHLYDDICNFVCARTLCIWFCHHLNENLARILAYATRLLPATNQRKTSGEADCGCRNTNPSKINAEIQKYKFK